MRLSTNSDRHVSKLFRRAILPATRTDILPEKLKYLELSSFPAVWGEEYAIFAQFLESIINKYINMNVSLINLSNNQSLFDTFIVQNPESPVALHSESDVQVPFCVTRSGRISRSPDRLDL